MVQGFGLFDVLRLGDGDLRAQRGFDEPARLGAAAFVHHGFSVVGVGGDGDAGGAAQVQIPEFVAGGNGGQQHVFGVMTVFVAAKGGVGRAEQVGFAGDFDGVIARIGGVGRCTAAQIARPFDGGAVGVLFAHVGLLVAWWFCCVETALCRQPARIIPNGGRSQIFRFAVH